MKNILDNIVNYKDIKNLQNNEIEQLSADLVEYIIKVVKTNGGHLGSPLGTIDLTLALLKVFNLDKDKIVWDIGHQSYAYKILTNRKEEFKTLRQFEGISGFSNPNESEFDLFIGGHSSTSISTAVGLKVGEQMQGQDNFVISVIGDAAIAAGMAFEAINHLASMPYNNIIILNDNNMSISNSVGALHNYLTTIRTLPSVGMAKKVVGRLRKKITTKFFNQNVGLKPSLGNLFSASSDGCIFSSLGLEYFGPVDGHNIPLLIEVLENIKNNPIKKPVLLHVNTTKGYGLEDANKKEQHAYNAEPKNNNIISNTLVFAKSLSDLAKYDNKIVAITAGMPLGTGLNEFAKLHAHKVFDVGIAEQHAVGFAAGLAKAGMKPFVCIYSTFLQRAYDQIIHDVAIAELPVKFILDRAGFVGADGCTHAGLFDYSMLGNLPNFTVMASVFKEDIEHMLLLMANYNKPISLRFNKANAISYSTYIKHLPKLEYGKGCILHVGKQDAGKKVAILGLGEILIQAFKCNEDLKQHNINATIADARFINPIDEDLIIKLATENDYLITLEESIGSVFGGKVLEVINKHNLFSKLVVKNLYVSNYFTEQASIEKQIELAKLDDLNITDVILKLIKK